MEPQAVSQLGCCTIVQGLNEVNDRTPYQVQEMCKGAQFVLNALSAIDETLLARDPCLL